MSQDQTLTPILTPEEVVQKFKMLCYELALTQDYAGDIHIKNFALEYVESCVNAGIIQYI